MRPADVPHVAPAHHVMLVADAMRHLPARSEQQPRVFESATTQDKRASTNRTWLITAGQHLEMFDAAMRFVQDDLDAMVIDQDADMLTLLQFGPVPLGKVGRHAPAFAAVGEK